MTANASELALDVRFDRELAWWRGNSCRYLVVEISTTAAGPDGERRPHDVAIAIDASAGMAGLRLAEAKQLALGIIGALGPDDSIAIVSFAGEARTELPSTIADDAGKDLAAAAVNRIEPRAGCDFAEGWLAAAEAAAVAMEKRMGSMAVVFVVSHGKADRGLRRPEELAQHAAELRSRGISTAAIAVGPGCDLSLLVAIDDPEGLHGQFAVAGGNDAVGALVANRLELSPLVAEDVRVLVKAPPRTQVTVLGVLPSETSGRELVCSLGDLRAGSGRTVVFKVIAPEGEVGRAIPFEVELTWNGRNGQPRGSEPVITTLTFAMGRENTPQERDPRATLIVLSQWRLKLLSDLINLNRQSRLREAELHLAREMKFIERYAQDVPAAGPLLNELRQALPMVHRPWRERQPLLMNPSL